MGGCHTAGPHPPPNRVGALHKAVSQPSPSFQLNTGLSTSCPYPEGRAQLQASASVTLLGCNLEMAPLGQNDPLPVPPVIWPLQFSVILCMGPGRQGADTTLISLSLSKGYMSEAIWAPCVLRSQIYGSVVIQCSNCSTSRDTAAWGLLDHLTHLKVAFMITGCCSDSDSRVLGDISLLFERMKWRSTQNYKTAFQFEVGEQMSQVDFPSL